MAISMAKYPHNICFLSSRFRLALPLWPWVLSTSKQY